MPRPSLTDEQRREIRHSIRSAAAKLFAENGMKDISARSIAKAANVSVGTIYAHFGSLTGLMQSFWKEPVRRLVGELQTMARQEPDPIKRLEKLLLTYIEFAESDPPLYRGSFMFVRPEGHEAPRQVELEDDGLFSVFRDAIADGQKAGEIREGDANELTQVIWSGIHGSITLPINIHRLALQPSRETTPIMLKLLLDWIKQP